MVRPVFGGGTNDETGRPTLDDPKNVKALTWMKQVMDAQGGFAKVKSFKDTMDVFGDKNQYVQDQVAVQTWAQWYVNVLSNTKDDVSLAAVPIKTLEGQPLAMAGGTAFAVAAAGKNKSAACAWAINATSEAAWVAAGTARAKTVEEKKCINTGLFTALPGRRRGRPHPVRQAERQRRLRPGDRDLLRDPAGQCEPRCLGGRSDRSIRTSTTPSPSRSPARRSPEQALADAQAASLRAWDQSKAGKK